MVYIPAILIVGFYFEKKRAMANGIANSGSGLGAFIYAPLRYSLRYLYSPLTQVQSALSIFQICRPLLMLSFFLSFRTAPTYGCDLPQLLN